MNNVETIDQTPNYFSVSTRPSVTGNTIPLLLIAAGFFQIIILK